MVELGDVEIEAVRPPEPNCVSDSPQETVHVSSAFYVVLADLMKSFLQT